MQKDNCHRFLAYIKEYIEPVARNHIKAHTKYLFKCKKKSFEM